MKAPRGQVHSAQWLKRDLPPDTKTQEPSHFPGPIKTSMVAKVFGTTHEVKSRSQCRQIEGNCWLFVAGHRTQSRREGWIRQVGEWRNNGSYMTE